MSTSFIVYATVASIAAELAVVAENILIGIRSVYYDATEGKRYT